MMQSVANKARQLCTFYLDEHLLGVDVERVREVVGGQRITPVPLAPPVVAGLINLRGQIVTVIHLRQRLGLPDRPAEAAPVQVLVGLRDTTLCLLVDRVGDVVSVPTADYAAAPETLDERMRGLIPGAYTLEDCLLLLLDCERVAQL